jgi:hypothetical protein
VNGIYWASWTHYVGWTSLDSGIGIIVERSSGCGARTDRVSGLVLSACLVADRLVNLASGALLNFQRALKVKETSL